MSADADLRAMLRNVQEGYERERLETAERNQRAFNDLQARLERIEAERVESEDDLYDIIRECHDMLRECAALVSESRIGGAVLTVATRAETKLRLREELGG